MGLSCKINLMSNKKIWLMWMVWYGIQGMSNDLADTKSARIFQLNSLALFLGYI
jgi:hypothetical protein